MFSVGKEGVNPSFGRYATSRVLTYDTLFNIYSYTEDISCLNLNIIEFNYSSIYVD